MIFPFENLRVGPFSSQYHRDNVGADFECALQGFLETNLLPQVTVAFEDVAGGVAAVFDNDRNCGPNSAVKNLYKIEIAFRQGDLVEEIKAELRYDAEKKTFETRRGGPLYLWSLPRKNRDRELRVSIDSVCRRIDRDGLVDADCPSCGGALRITNTPALFDVVCLNACFKYNFHRDPKTGNFEHGHFFMRPPSF